MQIRYTFKREGPGPSEQIVSIRTLDGEEQLVLSKRKTVNSQVEVGDPIASTNNTYLIELPRETASGKWRVWIPESEVVGTSMVAAE